MKERPMLFSGEMVRAIREGRKTQTRRIVKGSEDCETFEAVGDFWRGSWSDGKAHASRDWVCPYGQPGERLWVREALVRHNNCAVYAANYPDEAVPVEEIHNRKERPIRWEWKRPKLPSIHMPRWASRITLQVTAVRVERLQEISPEDVVCEGVELNQPELTIQWGLDAEARACFSELWQSINGPASWSANPWVWVVEFEKVKR